MKITELRTIKSDERGIIYDCDKLNTIKRKKGTINANHTHEDPEILYLVEGKVELTIGKETKVVSSPVKIEIESLQYHKLMALTDIILLEDREKE